MKNSNIISLLFVSALALSACGAAKEQLGLEKTAPDEFQVVKRAPLELPPSYALRPPAPGAARPQEQAAVEEARSAVLGVESTATASALPTTSEGALLKQAGAENIDPAIRQRVDSESAELKIENQPVVDKLLNLGKKQEPAASVLNPTKEAERLRQNSETGKSVTEGESPSL